MPPPFRFATQCAYDLWASISMKRIAPPNGLGIPRRGGRVELRGEMSADRQTLTGQDEAGKLKRYRICSAAILGQRR